MQAIALLLYNLLQFIEMHNPTMPFSFPGSMPGAILFGAILDHSCSLWETRCEGERSCLYYDNNSMAMHMLCLVALVKTLSTLFCFLSWRLYKSKAKMGLQEANCKMILQEMTIETQ